MKKALRYLCLLLILLPGVVMADNASGVEAYKQGNYQLAFQQFQEGANDGDVNAMYNLARLYQLGVGTKTNYQEALQWYKTAVAHGDIGSLVNLGFMYQNGLGVKKNDSIAIQYYKKALASNDSNLLSLQPMLNSVPAYNLANIYYDKHKFSLAMHYYKLAANAGDIPSQYYLGLGYLHGQGVAQNNQLAYEWLYRAEQGGYAPAQSALAELYAKLTPAQIQQLQQGS